MNMAESHRTAGAETTTRDEQTTPHQHQQPTPEQQSDPAQRSIEMEDLSSTTAKASAAPTAPSAAIAETTPATIATNNGIDSAEAVTKEAVASGQDGTSAGDLASIPAEDAAAAGPSDTAAGDDAQSKSTAKATGASAGAAPEQETLTIDPAEPTGDDSSPSDLVVDIMLIVTQSNSRHPFRISEKYLTKRNVTVTGHTEDGRPDPMSITVYTLKELILRDWRKEWEAPPREPVSIRLIYFGKMLEDKLPLSHYNFSHTAKNVVHMTVKPQEIIDEEEANKKVKESGSSSRGSGCCVIL